jgi:hypothetical protein
MFGLGVSDLGEKETITCLNEQCEAYEREFELPTHEVELVEVVGKGEGPIVELPRGEEPDVVSFTNVPEPMKVPIELPPPAEVDVVEPASVASIAPDAVGKV